MGDDRAQGASDDDPFGQAQYEAAGQGRDQAELVTRLQAWLRSGPPGLPDATVTGLALPSGGASSDLYLVDVATAHGPGGRDPFRVVVRMEPKFHVYPVVDLGHQFRCTLAAHRYSSAPVPEPYWYEPDAGVLGAPFIVAQREPGEAAADILGGWLVELSAAERERLWCRSLDALALVHGTDLAAAGIADAGLPAVGATAIDRYVAYWRRYLDYVSEDLELPVIEQAVAHLEAHRPVDVLPDSFVWGDARLGNILYVDAAPTALVDFEFAHVGLREFDVAFFSFFDHVLAEHFMGTQRLSGFLGHDESLDYYESVAGVPIAHRGYFTIMASTYNTLAVTRVLEGRARDGFVPWSFVRAHGPMSALADLLGVPRPTAS